MLITAYHAKQGAYCHDNHGMHYIMRTGNSASDFMLRVCSGGEIRDVCVKVLETNIDAMAI